MKKFKNIIEDMYKVCKELNWQILKFFCHILRFGWLLYEGQI